MANSNTKLTNDVYKKLINGNLFKDKNITITKFKEAFHSPQTPPEFRAVLLSSMYRNPIDIDMAYDTPSGREAKSYGGMGFGIYNNRLITKIKIGRTVVDLPKLKVPRILTQEAKSWKPAADKNPLLTKAFSSGNVHSQKIGLFLNEIYSAMYSMIDMLDSNIRYNDPEARYYGDSPIDEDEEKEKDKQKDILDFKTNESKFVNHLQHMAGEFSKYQDILNKLDINITPIIDRIWELRHAADDFVNTPYESNDDWVSALYDIHDQSLNLLYDFQGICADMDRLDLEDPNIYNIGRLEQIPKFVDYNPAKAERHSMNSRDGKLEEKLIETINSLINPNKK